VTPLQSVATALGLASSAAAVILAILALAVLVSDMLRRESPGCAWGLAGLGLLWAVIAAGCLTLARG